MTCEHCQSSAQRPFHGGYSFRCVNCCARLVYSAYPHRGQASVMLAAISRFRDAPPRDEILAGVAALVKANHE